MQDQIDATLAIEGEAAFTIQRACHFFRTGTLCQSETEKRAGWLMVPFGEVLIFSFEFAFLLRVVGTQTITMNMLVDSERAECLSGLAAEAWNDVCTHYAEDATRESLRCTANDWLEKVRRNGPLGTNGKGEYEDWHRRNPKDWFLMEFADTLSIPANVDNLHPKDWARRICESRLYDEPSSRWLASFARRARFSPQAEMTYGTRNLIVFPLWEEEPYMVGDSASGTSSASAEEATSCRKQPSFAAYFVATFYDEVTLTGRSGELVRSLLWIMAHPDVMRFASEAFVQREHVAQLKLYGEGLAHDISPRVAEAGGALDSIAKHTSGWFVRRSRIRGEVEKARRNLAFIEKLYAEYQDYSLGEGLADKLADTTFDLGRMIDYVLFLSPPDPNEGPWISVNIPRGVTARGDRHRLLRVVLNLLKNATQAMAQREVRDYWIKIEGHDEGDRILLDIADHGRGIPAELWSRVFEAGFTSDRQGGRRGMGLALTRQILEAHRLRFGAGSVRILDSGPDDGTTFRVEIPHGVGTEGEQ